MEESLGIREEEPARRGRMAPEEEPTSGGRLLLGWALIGVAVVMLFVGWWGVSGEPLVAAQLAWLVSGGLGGLLAGIVGVGLLVSNDVRKDRERLGRVEAQVLEMRDMLRAQAEAIAAIEEGGRLNGSRSGAGRGSRARGAGR